MENKIAVLFFTFLLYYSIMGAFVFLFLALFWYPFSKLYILFHELSHALVGVLLTRDRVTMYVGSYGDQQNNISFNTGLLEWRIRYNFIQWRGGMCIMHGKNISSWAKVMYILAGSVLPFIIATVSAYLLFIYQANEALQGLAIAFWFFTFYHMFYSLLASPHPVKLADGSITYNDGQMIRQEFAFQNAKVFYDKAIEYYQRNAYDATIVELEHALRIQPESTQSYEILMSCWLKKENYTKAKTVAERCLKYGSNIGSDAYNMIGYVYFSVKEYERSLQYYSLALKEDPKNVYALYNKGFVLNLLNYYEKAIPNFEQVLQLDPEHAEAHNNLGFALMKVGLLEEGAAYIKQSIRLDDRNAYAHRNLGGYHLQKQEYPEALKLLKRAKYLDAKIPNIDHMIAKAENGGQV